MKPKTLIIASFLNILALFWIVSSVEHRSYLFPWVEYLPKSEISYIVLFSLSVIAAFILSVISIIKIRRNNSLYKGQGLAILNLIPFPLVLLIIVLVYLVALAMGNIGD